MSLFKIVAVLSIAVIHPIKAGERDEAIVRELVAAKAATFDPGGATSVLDPKVEGLLRELDPSAYELAALALIQPQERHYHKYNYPLVMKWVAADPKRAFEFLSARSPDLIVGNVADDLFREWAFRDDTQALAAARTVLPEGNRPDLVSIVLEMMAVKSPHKAMLEIDQVDSRYTNVESNILVYWVTVNPTEATRWALEQPRHHQLVWDAAFSWSSFDFKAATEWASVLGEEDRTMALTGILNQRITKQESLARIAEEFLRLFPSPALNQETYSNQAVTSIAEAIARTWSEQDNAHPDVMAWVMKLPDVPRREAVASEVLRQWAAKNSDQMEKYSESLNEGTLKESAKQILVWQHASKNPSKGFEKAKSITDEGRRTSAMGTLFNNWLRANPDQANAAMATLTEQQKESVIKRVSEIRENSRRTPIE